MKRGSQADFWFNFRFRDEPMKIRAKDENLAKGYTGQVEGRVIQALMRKVDPEAWEAYKASKEGRTLDKVIRVNGYGQTQYL